MKYIDLPGRKDAEEPLRLLASCKDPKNTGTDNFKGKQNIENNAKVQII